MGTVNFRKGENTEIQPIAVTISQISQV